MESNTFSPSPDNADAKAAFRKPSNDTTSRKYRRRSPVGGSSSSEGSPKRERSSSPTDARDDSARERGSWRRKDDERDRDRDSGKNHHGRSGDAYRQSDRQSSRSSHDNHRRDSHGRRDKLIDEDERHYAKSSSYSGRENARKENEHHKSRHYSQGDEKYSRDRSEGSGHRNRDKDRDERKAYRKGEYKGDRSPVYEDSRGHRNNSGSRREGAGHRWNETKNDPKELDGQKYAHEEKRKSDHEASRQKDRHDRQPGEQFKERNVLNSENEDSPRKKLKAFSLGTDNGKDVDEYKSTKQVQEPGVKVNSEQALASGCTAADIDAAKMAAMRAAELVNKNLIGTGYMSADQKKKLLWGKKKSTTADESSHRWDSATFSDREQQEKFNKLMGVKGEVKLDQKTHTEKQKEVELDLEKQYVAGLRRRDGRTVGLGL